MFAYCENNPIFYVDQNGTSAIIAPKKNSEYSSIYNSRLDQKPGSTMSYYSGKRNVYGYNVYTYTRMIGIHYFYKSEYYALTKTLSQWKTYINKNWGGLKSTKSVLLFLTEFFSYSNNYWLSNLSTIANFCMSNYVPKQERYILEQLLYPSNRHGNKYTICFYVINTYNSVYYVAWYRRNVIRTFNSNKYYAY